MALVFASCVLVGLSVAAMWAWELIRHWTAPPPHLTPHKRMFGRLRPVVVWRVASAAGIVAGLSVAVFAAAYLGR